MSKFGDESAFLTWMLYVRWPLFGFVAAILGLLVGLIFGGLIGALAGLIAGLFMGTIAGFVLGKNKKMFPVIVERWVKYGGDFPKLPQRYPGRVNTRTFQQEAGPPVEDVRVEYLEGRTLRRIPNFGPPVWTNENNTPILKVVQVDRLVYLPMSSQGGRLTIHRVPVYRTFEVVDNKGNRRLEYFKAKTHNEVGPDGRQVKVFDKDENGNLIPDPNGEPIVDHVEDVTVIDFNKMQDLDGKVVDVPMGMAAKLNNDRAEFTQAWSIMSALYEMSNWWKENKGLIYFVVTVAATLMTTYWFYDSLNGNMSRLISTQNQQLQMITAQNLEIAKLNAQITAYWLRVGFNYSATFVYGGVLNNATAGVGNPTPTFSIPYIT